MQWPGQHTKLKGVEKISNKLKKKELYFSLVELIYNKHYVKIWSCPLLNPYSPYEYLTLDCFIKQINCVKTYAEGKGLDYVALILK